MAASKKCAAQGPGGGPRVRATRLSTITALKLCAAWRRNNASFRISCVACGWRRTSRSSINSCKSAAADHLQTCNRSLRRVVGLAVDVIAGPSSFLRSDAVALGPGGARSAANPQAQGQWPDGYVARKPDHAQSGPIESCSSVLLL